jgi:hypothetical protein
MKLTIETITKPMKVQNINQAKGQAGGFPFAIDLDLLSFTIGGETLGLKRIDGTRGGFRYFFLCPECGRSCRLLYYNGGDFACGGCHDVYKKTLNRSKNCQYYFNQAMKEAWKVEQGYQPKYGYISYDFPSRPKYMNHKRYWRHYRRYLKLFEKGLKLWLQGR